MTYATDLLAPLARLGIDVLAMLLLVGVLYRRRLAAPEMALVFTALNIGLFAAITSIGSGDFPTGIGFRLFGLLSLVRLRSAAFTLKDVAYTFVADTLGTKSQQSAPYVLHPSLRTDHVVAAGQVCPCSYPSRHAAAAAAATTYLSARDSHRGSDYRWMQSEIDWSRLHGRPRAERRHRRRAARRHDR